MREGLIEFGRESELRADGGHDRAPLASYVGPDMSVKGGVDLTAIEILSEIFQRMNLFLFQILQIDDTLSVLVRESCRTDKDFVFGSHRFTLAHL
jgi:hypothetical protein